MSKWETILIRAAREVMLPLLILAAFLVVASFVPRRSSSPWVRVIHAQQPLPVALDQDPHFRLLLSNQQVRVFELTLAPNSESFVRYEHNNLTIAPDEGEIIMWKDGESPIQHFRQQRGQLQFFLGDSVRGYRNDARSGEYHAILVEFLVPGVTSYGYRYYSGKWDYGPSIMNPPAGAAGHFVNSLDLNRAVASDVQLLPKEFLPPSPRRQLLVAISGVDLQTGKRSFKLAPGEVLWLEGREAELVCAGNDPSRFALVELKTADEQY